MYFLVSGNIIADFLYIHPTSLMTKMLLVATMSQYCKSHATNNKDNDNIISQIQNAFILHYYDELFERFQFVNVQHNDTCKHKHKIAHQNIHINCKNALKQNKMNILTYNYKPLYHKRFEIQVCYIFIVLHWNSTVLLHLFANVCIVQHYLKKFFP
ncbi:hypothetical protein RFI_21494 [Reticulomyxa filosa]|uniref:Uncharacterized protein n=1 Tax=Reticulomyxa filosa TaxID=46433 RepID=X6MS29_RETFI|nr:hypothetical protein RFI_21494 [Reticulomyxa filosa]|eukprot:ETO15870.1 hypothetical protein RFI_21494 [Reticulomyxa filosa]